MFALRNSSCFSSSHLAQITETMTRQTVKRGTVIFWDDEPAERWYYVFHGQVKVTKPSDDGKDFVFHLFREGDFFGQAYPQNGGKNLFKAEALEDAELGVLQSDDLETLLLKNPSLAYDYIQWLERIRLMTMTRMRDLMLYGKSGALCSTLIRLANTFGISEERGIRIAAKISNTELSDYVGCARESVSRMLSDLKKQGIVSMDNGQILIHDMDYLKGICRCDYCPKEICRI